jgi:ATP phosphoribosyltransferase regulatory subunit
LNFLANTPEGTRDRLFSECQERRQIQSALTSLFASRGYHEVITPEVEYYDLFTQSGSLMPQESLMKIIDRSGMILVMRPDCTTPIARVAATKLKTLALPQRLYYDQTVFRSGAAHQGGSIEIAQCGIELIGASGPKADLEMVAMAVDALRSCGVDEFHIELGHAGFFRTLAALMEMPQDDEEKMRSLIEGKNFAALNDLLANYRDRSSCAALSRLSHLFGGAEVLDEAEALAGENEDIGYLRSLYTELEAAGYASYVRFDLGMVHQIDYYTGVVFRGYVSGAGAPVLSGGRYDHLAEAFGRPADATGFAVDVDAVAGCLPNVKIPPLQCVVYYGSGELARALQTVDAYPAGFCELSPCRTLESTVNLAREKGALTVVVLENGEERTIEV